MKTFQRGELTTQQIVVITILITSFIVILFLLFRLNLGTEDQKQICHNSVLLIDKSFGTLNCKVNYVCVSGGGSCENINPTETVNIDPNDNQQIMKVISDKMAECWWMFGEGKVDYTKGKINWLGTTACAICSSVKFDESLKNRDVSNRDLFTFLSQNKYGDGTYLSYLFGTYDLNSLNLKDDFLNKKIDFSSQNLLVTGVTKEGVLDWKGFVTGIFKATDLHKAFLHVSFVKNSDIGTEGCDEFVTKA